MTSAIFLAVSESLRSWGVCGGAVGQVLSWSMELSRALCFLHNCNPVIIHRDLKPANILLADGEKVRITDFGVSKLMTGGSDVTSSGELVGTPHYMPPEQAGGSSLPVSAASDIYSIGAVLYAMLTGRPPFVAASPVEVVGQVVAKQPIRPSALIPSVPHELEVITLKCLNKKPADLSLIHI